jgi:hypothetical protein
LELFGVSISSAKIAVYATVCVFCFIFNASQTRSEEIASVTSEQRYPTSEEVFYVLSCMERNGEDAAALQKCSCAVNALEETLPFDQYKDAEMVVALRQAGGRTVGIFRDTSPMRDIVKVFIEAQKAANTRCFGEKATPKGNGAAHQ